jgi:hypothetical protein
VRQPAQAFVVMAGFGIFRLLGRGRQAGTGD